MDRNFRELLTRYLQGNCTPEEMAAVNQWYREIEAQDLELEEWEKKVIETRMLQEIRKSVFAGPSQKGRRRYMPLHTVMKLAAAVALLTAFGVWFFRGGESFNDSTPVEVSVLSDLVHYENNSAAARLFELPDGSTVTLEASARISFPREFAGTRREVHLNGKGFFNVTKDPSKPFYVYTGKIAVRVLGTSFFVDASSFEKRVSVKVVSGEVSVFEVTEKGRPRTNKSRSGSRKSNGVVLTPNQKVDYIVDGGHWVTGLVEDPVPLKGEDGGAGSFVFANTPVRDVLIDINDRYGIEVVTENERIGNCTFTGDVSQMPLYNLLDALCTAIGSSYEVKGTRILISGDGCP